MWGLYTGCKQIDILKTFQFGRFFCILKVILLFVNLRNTHKKIMMKIMKAVGLLGFFAFFSVELGAQTPVAPTISGYYAGVNGGYNMPLSNSNPEYVKFSFGEGVYIGFTRGI